jgi:hypothetical protein
MGYRESGRRRRIIIERIGPKSCRRREDVRHRERDNEGGGRGGKELSKMDTIVAEW